MGKESEHNDTNNSHFILKWTAYILIREPWAFQMTYNTEINNTVQGPLSYIVIVLTNSP